MKCWHYLLMNKGKSSPFLLWNLGCSWRKAASSKGLKPASFKMLLLYWFLWFSVKQSCKCRSHQNLSNKWASKWYLPCGKSSEGPMDSINTNNSSSSNECHSMSSCQICVLKCLSIDIDASLLTNVMNCQLSKTAWINARRRKECHASSMYLAYHCLYY